MALLLPGCNFARRTLTSWKAAVWGEEYEMVTQAEAVQDEQLRNHKLAAKRTAEWEKDSAGVDEVSPASYYNAVASHIDYGRGSLAEGKQLRAEPPLPVRPPEKEDLLDLTLSQAIQIAMMNSEIIRVDSDFLSPRAAVLQDVGQAPSIFDVALQDSGFLFGRRGEAAAMSDFAPQLSQNMIWSRNEEIQNNLNLSGGLTPGDTLTEEAARYTARAEKILPTGSTVAMNMNWNYSMTNQARLFESVYTGAMVGEFRHPLLAGSGKEFTSIAGPLGRVNQSVTGVNQGVVIARINTDISVLDFESNVRNLVFDVERVYWDLVQAFKRYEAEQENADSLEKIWDSVKALIKQGAEGGSAAAEAQAADAYFQARSSARHALADVYDVEGRLRRLMALPSGDGKLLHPVDRPQEWEVAFQWDRELATALTNRLELRRQKMNLRSLELQLRAARNLARPRVDFLATYRVNGFGDQLMATDKEDGVTQQGLRSAFGTLQRGDQTGWELGFQSSIPLGFQAERAQIRNLEFQLAKGRAGLAVQEQEISHEMRNAVTGLQRWYGDLQLASERRTAADRRLAAFQAEYKAGRTTLDLLVRARLSSAEARVAYHRALAEYNKAIANFNYRSGTNLERGGIQILDGLPMIDASPLDFRETPPPPSGGPEVPPPPAPSPDDPPLPPLPEKPQVQNPNRKGRPSSAIVHADGGNAADAPSGSVRWEIVSARTARFDSADAALVCLAHFRKRALNVRDEAPDAYDRRKLDIQSNGWTNPASVESAAIRTVLRSQPVGEIGPIVKDDGGYHLVRVLERRGEEPATPPKPDRSEAPPTLRKLFFAAGTSRNSNVSAADHTVATSQTLESSQTPPGSPSAYRDDSSTDAVPTWNLDPAVTPASRKAAEVEKSEVRSTKSERNSRLE